MSMLERLQASPTDLIEYIVQQLETADPDWLVNTRNDLVDIDAHLRRISPEAILESRRAARVTEWHMARRWPANDDGVRRTDDRPALHGSNADEALHGSNAGDRVAWQRVYAVGRADLDWLLTEDNPDRLTQVAVVQHVAAKRVPTPTETPTLPADRYRTIVIDPPWPVTKIVTEARPFQGVDLDYPTMTLAQIARLPVDDLAEDAAHLYLWATHKLLPDALDLVGRWGFGYQCLLTWCKPTGAVPFSWMYDTEHCLFCRRGDLDVQKMGQRLAITGGRGDRAHSTKPDEFYDKVIAASPEPRLEMFARQPRDGFTVWGNEVADAS